VVADCVHGPAFTGLDHRFREYGSATSREFVTLAPGAAILQRVLQCTPGRQLRWPWQRKARGLGGLSAQTGRQLNSPRRVLVGLDPDYGPGHHERFVALVPP
jgi:hypothetical protein